MLHVVLDTSIYRQDPKREKSAFRALTRLCQGKKVKLHVPDFVRREFVSQQKQFMEKDILAAQKAAEAMIKKAVEGEIVEHAEGILAEAEESLKKVQAWAVETFQSWVKKCDGRVARATPSIGEWFSGGAGSIEGDVKRKTLLPGPEGEVSLAIQPLSPGFGM